MSLDSSCVATSGRETRKEKERERKRKERGEKNGSAGELSEEKVSAILLGIDEASSVFRGAAYQRAGV
jgi:hypothetical protein